MWADFINAAEVPESGGLRYNAATGRNYLAMYGDAGLQGYGAEGGDYLLGAPTAYLSFDPSATRDNQGPYLIHDAAGNITGRGNFTKAQNIERLALTYAAILAAAGYGASTLLGSGTPAGAGGALSKAALDGTTAFGANSVAGAYELGSLASSIGTTASTTAASIGESLKSLPGLVKQAGPLLSALGLTGAAASPQPARVATAQTGADLTPLWLIGGAVALYLILKG